MNSRFKTQLFATSTSSYGGDSRTQIAWRLHEHPTNNEESIIGTFVIEHKMERLYRDVLTMLDEFTDIRHGLVFPITEYYYYGIKAILTRREGDVKGARLLARKALEAADKQISGLSRHPRAGLASEKESVFHDELVGIAQ